MNKVFFSNRWEELADALGDALFCTRQDPFAKREVIVPSQEKKDFLLHTLAGNPKWGIAAGLSISTLVQAFAKKSGLKIASSLEIALMLEGEMESLPSGDPLHTYIANAAERRTALCKQLGELFFHYGLHGEPPLEPIWQQELYKRLCLWTTSPLELALQDIAWEGEVHLFGLPALAEPLLSFFQRKGASFYLFSPSSLFWVDICTETERFSRSASMQLDAYLSDRHPFLANMGRYGRGLMALAEDERFSSEERYINPGRDTLLHSFQSDILELAPPQDATFSSKDRSLALFSAPSRLREVEILREEVGKMLSADPTLRPSDIRVFAPHIASYAPYFAMVFGFSSVELVIRDLPQESQSPLAHAFLQLLSLRRSRWEKREILQLFSMPAFREKRGWSEEDVGKICQWVDRVGIRWGFDQSHRSRFLERAEQAGSWSFGLSTLLKELVLLPKKEGLERHLIELQDAKLLGEFASTLSELSQDLLLGAVERSSREWADWLSSLLERYFSYTSESRFFFSQLSTLLFDQPEEARYSFEPLWQLVRTTLSQHTATENASALEAIPCASLKSGSALPARVIYLLGLDENSFPKQESEHTLLPPVSDKSRYLFLELVMAARERLFLSYPRISPDDHREQSPSCVVDELFTALDASYKTEAGELPSRCLQLDCPAALVEQRQRPKSAPPPIPVFDKMPPVLLSLESLGLCARHPIRFYCQEVLKLFFPLQEEEEEEEIALSPLLKGRMRGEAMRRSLDDLLADAERYSALPCGLFKEVAHERIAREVQEMQDHLLGLGVDPKELFSLEFVRGCRQLEERRPREFFAPPLIFTLAGGDKVELVGKVPSLCSKGLVVHGENTIEEMVRIWPQWLVVQLVAQQLPSLVGSQLILSKEGVIRESCVGDPLHALHQYLAYFAVCLKQISPLFPPWSLAWLKGDAAKVEALWGESRFADPYIAWFAQRHPSDEAAAWFAAWQNPLHTLFEPLCTAFLTS